MRCSCKWVLGGLLFGLAAAVACGGNTQQSPGRTDTPAGATGATEPTMLFAGAGGNAPIEDGAGTLAGASGSPAAVEATCMPSAELLASPREDENLEALALARSDAIVADPAVYERVVRDVASIRALEPSLADIAYWLDQVPNELLVYVDESTLKQMQTGEYSAWDCLNAKFRVTNISYATGALGSRHLVVLEHDGNYDGERLSHAYAELPGVLGAEHDGTGGDGSTICLTTGPSTWHYVFDRADGDCPAGCTEHDYAHFSTEPDGSVAQLGSWQLAEPIDEMTPPSWVAQYASEEACR